MSSSEAADSRLLQVRLPLSTPEAIERLSQRVAAEKPLRFAVGDWSDGYVGVFRGATFRIRRATRLAQPYAVQAYGSVRDDDGGCVLTVHFRRSRVMIGMVWVMRIFMLLLLAGTLLAATRQPVFLAFSLFVAVGAGALLWNARERQGDRQDLRRLIHETFPDVQDHPAAR